MIAWVGRLISRGSLSSSVYERLSQQVLDMSICRPQLRIGPSFQLVQQRWIDAQQEGVAFGHGKIFSGLLNKLRCRGLRIRIPDSHVTVDFALRCSNVLEQTKFSMVERSSIDNRLSVSIATQDD